MNIGKCDLLNDLFFIVEEGQFNLGSYEKALQMIEITGKTGATAIEFQLAYADDFYITSDQGHQIYKGREFSDQQLKDLVDFSRENGLEFVATCLSHKLVNKMAAFGCSAFNINASDINNLYIVDAVIESGLPFLVSTPLAYEEEIDWVVERAYRIKGDAQFILMHGQHSMASGKDWVATNDTALGYLKTLSSRYNRPVGFIDHTPTPWMPAVAVAAGAQAISKHLTLNALYKGPDWAICLEPTEMKVAIENARQVYESMKIDSKHLAKGEDLDRSVMRRSVVAERDINQGKVIEWEDLSFKRPGTGMAPPIAEDLIGKIAQTDIPKDKLLTIDLFQEPAI